MTSAYERRLERNLEDEEWKKSMKNRDVDKAKNKGNISLVAERLERKKKKQSVEVKAAPSYSSVGSLSKVWQTRTNNFQASQKLNPWSGDYAGDRKWDPKCKESYAQPVGKTRERWKKGNAYINKEINMMVEIIQAMGERDENGNIFVYFGRLFDRYAKISTNLVGYLIRARRRGMLHFEGEMLWQRQDDDAVITLSDEYSMKD